MANQKGLNQFALGVTDKNNSNNPCEDKKRCRDMSSTGHVYFRTNLRRTSLALASRPANPYIGSKVFIGSRALKEGGELWKENLTMGLARGEFRTKECGYPPGTGLKEVQGVAS